MKTICNKTVKQHNNNGKSLKYLEVHKALAKSAVYLHQQII